MQQVPKGENFLRGYDLKYLETLYKKEKDSKAKIRLQAAILRKKNKVLEEISGVVGYPLTTVGDWLRRIHIEGIHRRYSTKQSGRPSRLTINQKKELQAILKRPPTDQDLPFAVWTTKILLHFIHETYQVSYKIRQIERLVKNLGFSVKKARPEHRKANKEAQEAFKKKFKQKFKQEFTMDSRSFVLTRSTSA